MIAEISSTNSAELAEWVGLLTREHNVGGSDPDVCKLLSGSASSANHEIIHFFLHFHTIVDHSLLHAPRNSICCREV